MSASDLARLKQLETQNARMQRNDFNARDGGTRTPYPYMRNRLVPSDTVAEILWHVLLLVLDIPSAKLAEIITAAWPLWIFEMISLLASVALSLIIFKPAGHEEVRDLLGPTLVGPAR
jgi:hypothetical protein